MHLTRIILRPRARRDLEPIQSYIIFYFPLPDGIRVARVLHGARDSASIFEDEPDTEEQP